jgi:hypothetical protein
MSGSLFPQNVVALIWDFDKTLSPVYMQRPLFEAYGIDEGRFWNEVRALSAHYRQQGLSHVADDTMYLNHLLTYAAAGRLPGCTNARLRELGSGIPFFPGLPDAFGTLRQRVLERSDGQVLLEHHVVSNGLREMIMGSAIAAELDDVWACEFIEQVAPPGYLDEPVAESGPGHIAQVAYAIDNTTKTRAIFEINKGANVEPDIGVNDAIPRDQRRVPFEHMLYVADGPSDIPVFSLVGGNGGATCAVYAPGDRSSFTKANELLRQSRVDIVGPADYREESQTWLWLTDRIDQIADGILARYRAKVEAAVSKPPASY